MTARTGSRRKLAVATWRAPREGRLHGRLAVDATAVVESCARQSAHSGVRISPTLLVGMAFQRGVVQVPAFHHRVVFGRVLPYRTYDMAFAVDIGAGVDLAPTKVCGVDRKSVIEVARELEAGAERLRAGQDGNFESVNVIARAMPGWTLRPLLSGASLLHGGLGVNAFGMPAHPMGSLLVTSIGSGGLDEGFVAPVPFARVPLYVCVGAVADAPMAVDGRVVVRPQLVITATADHRLVDGAHAAALARFVRAALADPDLLDRPAHSAG